MTSAFVNGSAVSLEGHGHSVADIDGLGTMLSAYASSGHTHSEYAAVSHSHVIADVTNLETTLSGFASSGHTHDELSGITQTSISKANGNFGVLTASTATFTNLTVSTATFDVEVIDTSSINVVDLTASNLNITNTVQIVGASVSALNVEDLNVSGSMLYNNKEVATQEYVQQMISVAIGQVLASQY